MEAALSIPSFFGTRAESSGSVARATSHSLLLSYSDLDLRAGELALSSEALARENLGLRLKASTGQVFRIVATETRSGIKERHALPSRDEVWRSLHQHRAASSIRSWLCTA